MTEFIKFIPDEKSMLEFAADVAANCPDAIIIFLLGNLGAGKTTFARGFLRGLGQEGSVKSPTYTIVEPYQFSNHIVYHFDFYRIKDLFELELIGIQDYFTPDAICLIEWPENGAGLLPPADMSCYIEMRDTGREIRMVGHSDKGRDVLKRLQNEK